MSYKYVDSDLESFEEKMEEYRRTSASKAGRQTNDLRQAIADAEAESDGVVSFSSSLAKLYAGLFHETHSSCYLFSTSVFVQDPVAHTEQDSSVVTSENTSFAASQTPLDDKPDQPDETMNLMIDADGKCFCYLSF